MRLDRLYIKKYRVLENVEIDFMRDDQQDNSVLDIQQGYNLDFLVGVNGTGKSTLLRLLARIFDQLLTQNYVFPVPIELEYTIQTEAGEEKQIQISNLDPDDKETMLPQLFWRERDNKIDEWGIANNTGIRPGLLPRQIVIYTTGNEDIWLNELDDERTEDDIPVSSDIPENIFLEELPGHTESITTDEEDFSLSSENRFLFIQSSRLPLVTLCGLLAALRDTPELNSDHTLSKVLEAVGLEGIQGFSLRLRSYDDLTPRIQRDNIERLRKIANLVIQKGSDLLLIFDIEEQFKIFKNEDDDRDSIFDEFGEPIQLFQQLYLLYEHQRFYEPPLQEVNIFLRPVSHEKENRPKTGQDMLYLFDWLSDGERSFLARMALFALFSSGNMLIMLDEPEIHFNDIWKREIVNILDVIMRANPSREVAQNHALITTHSSITLTDVRREDILILHRRENLSDKSSVIRLPDMETLGADPSDILVHVFGARSATGIRSSEYLRGKIGTSTPEELEALKKVVAPGYWRYRIELEIRRIPS